MARSAAAASKVRKRMRFCFVTVRYPTHHPREGAGLDTQQLARGVVQRGHTAHVVCVSDDGYAAQENDDGVAVSFVPPRKIPVRPALKLLAALPGLRDLKEAWCGWGMVETAYAAWREMRRLHRMQPFDVVQVVDLGGLALFCVRAWYRPAPVIIRGHGFVDPALPGSQWCGATFQQRLERTALRHADFVAANSVYLRDYYCTHYGVPRDRSGVLYNGIEFPAASPVLWDVRQLNGWGTDDPIVLYVGRLEFLKGIDVLFAAIQQARRRQANLRLIMLGETQPSFQADYAAFMRDRPDWVWHPGNVTPEQVSQILREATLLVQPSRKETLGRALIEAQLHGVPVIGTRAGGAPEVVEDKVTGLLVEPGHVEQLAQAILSLVQNPTLAQELSRRAQSRAAHKFGLPSIIEQEIALACDVVKQQSASQP
jgi:glycosyltransferase involved in cell wall biosynthesis